MDERDEYRLKTPNNTAENTGQPGTGTGPGMGVPIPMPFPAPPAAFPVPPVMVPPFMAPPGFLPVPPVMIVPAVMFPMAPGTQQGQANQDQRVHGAGSGQQQAGQQQATSEDYRGSEHEPSEQSLNVTGSSPNF